MTLIGVCDVCNIICRLMLSYPLFTLSGRAGRDSESVMHASRSSCAFLLLALFHGSDSFLSAPLSPHGSMKLLDRSVFSKTAVARNAHASTNSHSSFSSTNHLVLTHQRTPLSMTGQSYVLDSFDPDEDELSDELSNQNMLRIIKGDVPDNEVNLLLWKCLGYKLIDGVWTSDDVFPKWRSKYPNPPDVIGERCRV
jgi:hypothetical protein